MIGVKKTNLKGVLSFSKKKHFGRINKNKTAYFFCKLI